jgi:hypothetical protein
VVKLKSFVAASTTWTLASLCGDTEPRDKSLSRVLIYIIAKLLSHSRFKADPVLYYGFLCSSSIYVLLTPAGNLEINLIYSLVRQILNSVICILLSVAVRTQARQCRTLV